MSSSAFRKAQKAHRRTYKERGQLESRSKFGFLEKHKDYVKRARNYHSKQNRLKALSEKAAFRNPDEFYYGMVNEKTNKGVHVVERNKNLRGDIQKLVKGQDLTYVQLMEGTEKKKVERLSKSVLLTGLDDNDDNSPDKHIIFVDSKTKARNFDAAEYFDTYPSLVGNKQNRLKKDTLKKDKISFAGTKPVKKQRNANLRELSKRIDRAELLESARQELTTQKHLLNKGDRKKVGKDDSNNNVYRWKSIRKR